ncbi:deoxycytidyl transferase [Gonapodya sp. JEL0774]|nr:deoxycytidyl transferase [Gonapodya sp. JEL0774]
MIAGNAGSGSGRGGGDRRGGNGGGGWENFGEYFRDKNRKLKEQDAAVQAADGESVVFKGTKIYIDGWTDPPAHELKKMILKAGGEYEQYFRKSVVTHVVASNMTARKVSEWGTVKILTPNWITDSLAHGKLLPWNRYKLIPVSSSQGKISAVVEVRQETPASEYKGLQGIAGKALELSERTVKESQIQTLTDGARHDGTASTSLNAVVEGPKSMPNAISVDPNPFTDLLENDTLDVVAQEGRSSVQVEHDIMDIVPISKDAPTPPPSALVSVSPITTAIPPLSTANAPAFALPFGAAISPAETNTTFPRPGTPPFSSKSPYPQPIPHIDPATPPATRTVQNCSASVSAAVSPDHPTMVELSTEWGRKNSTVTEGFLEGFYSNSRLHLISTTKLELQEFVEKEMQLRAPTATGKSSGRKDKTYMHIDLDCFFVSVSIRDRPDLLGKPVAVTHGSASKDSRADIASCSYEARRFGVSNGMWLGEAKRKCPELILVPYDFENYVAVAKDMYRVLVSHADDIEAKSIDEGASFTPLAFFTSYHNRADTPAVIDVTSRVGDRSPESALSLAETIRAEIKSKTGCNASVGISSNLLLARVATKKAKPNGAFYLGMENASEFLAGQKVDSLPGVGWAIARKLLEEKKITTVGQLAQLSKAELQRDFGDKTGESLYNFARGIDDRVIKRDAQRSTVSAEVNWGVRFENRDQLDTFLSQDLTKEVVKRLAKVAKKGAAITLKVLKKKPEAHVATKSLGHGWTDAFSKTRQLGVATNDVDVIGREVLGLLRGFELDPLDVRGLGISMSRLVDAKADGQKTLDFFSVPTKTSAQKEQESKSDTSRHLPGTVPGNGFKVPFPKDKTKRVANPPAVSPQAPGTSLSMDVVEEFRAPNVKVMDPRPGASSSITASQIDPGVLSELPANLRAEIIREYRMHGGQSSSTELRVKSPPAKRQKTKRSGVATLVERNQAKANWSARTGGSSNAHPQGLPPESQLDESVLGELPEEIRREVEVAYGKARKTHAPEKSKRPLTSSSHPTLLGVPSTNLDGLRGVLDSWVSSTVPETGTDADELSPSQKGPLKEDTLAVTKFLIDAVSAGELECAELLCLYLRRRTAGIEEWGSVTASILEQVQIEVRQIWGKGLKRLN